MFDMNEHGDGDGDDPEYERRHAGVSVIAERLLSDAVDQARNTGTCVSCTVFGVISHFGATYLWNLAKATCKEQGIEGVLDSTAEADQEDERVVKLSEMLAEARNEMMMGMRAEFAMLMIEAAAERKAAALIRGDEKESDD